jgi:hypothetical protein
MPVMPLRGMGHNFLIPGFRSASPLANHVLPPRRVLGPRLELRGQRGDMFSNHRLIRARLRKDQLQSDRQNMPLADVANVGDDSTIEPAAANAAQYFRRVVMVKVADLLPVQPKYRDGAPTNWVVSLVYRSHNFTRPAAGNDFLSA